ncbi:MAG: hypothetical protein ACHQU0_00900 [Candidatus Paceibacteria bacterium]
MTLDFSQKRLLGKSFLRHKHQSKRDRRLQVYAVLTGFLSLLISIATLIVRILK